MTTVSLSHRRPADEDVDVVVVAAASGPGGVRLLLGPDQVRDPERLVATLRLLGATGKDGETVKASGEGHVRAGLVMSVGVGGGLPASESAALEALRRAAGTAARTLAGTVAVGFALPLPVPGAIGAVAEGIGLGAYTFASYKSTTAPAPLARALILTTAGPMGSAEFSGDQAGGPAPAGDRNGQVEVDRALVLTEAVAAARDLINTPPQDLSPSVLADIAAEWAREHGLEVEVLDEAALREGGYGGILGVGQGSSRPPRLVRIAYRHEAAHSHLALVGKGITFDSGGLSIKPTSGMVTMKADMSGAAAVLAAVVAVARRSVTTNVTAYAALAENMPSGTAIRPSDVLRMHGGKTVEVLNTDAEGRLVLADALARAGEDAPDMIVDVATLTGACVAALGSRTAGLMASDDGLRDRVRDAAEAAGESLWPLPLPEYLREKLDSPVADLQNMGDTHGGALTAALFLREFVPLGLPWAHLDIAGPAFNAGSPYGYVPKGGVGFAVATLLRLAEDVAATGSAPSMAAGAH